MQSKLKTIFNKNYNALCNFATSIIKDKHGAEDIVQTVFIQLWENDKFKDLENPDVYLVKCVRYKCIDYIRSQQKKKEIHLEKFPELTAKKQALEEEDITPLLHYFASKLPPKTQRVFLMSRKNGLSYKEIADELNVSTKTVENQMGSALKTLRNLLKEHKYIPFLLILL